MTRDGKTHRKDEDTIKQPSYSILVITLVTIESSETYRYSRLYYDDD